MNKTGKTNSARHRKRKRQSRGEMGFSLFELLIALAVFVVISASAFSLFNQQQSNSHVLQGQVGLNLALRNAVAQMQIDLANAGSGYFQGNNIPSWPVGVTVDNNVVAADTSCYDAATSTYGASCFDRLNVISAADPTNFPPVKATDDTGGTSPTANCSVTSAGVAYAQAATGLSLAQTAAKFKKDDQLLFLNNTGTKITSVVLTQNATATSSAVQLTFNPTLVDTANNIKGFNSLANDPLDITACNDTRPCAVSGKLDEQFCGGDWILKLAPITYWVDITTDPANPRLMRRQNGTDSVIMEEVIGFKVGAAIWNAVQATSSAEYDYNAADPGYDYNFSLVRSVRVSLIGRTAPDTRGTSNFRNSFDQGPYQVQGIAIVVNPRNMSMND